MKQNLLSVWKHESDLTRARLDLEFFSTYCWELDPKHRGNAPFHKEIYRILQGDKDLVPDSEEKLKISVDEFLRHRRLLILAPREHAKTTCVSVKYPLWELGHNRNLRILFVSKTSTLATDALREVRLNIERNERLHAVFPDLKSAKPWSGQEFVIQRSRIDKTPTMRGVGLHASITGGRADVIIVDDPFDEAEVRTQSQRVKVETWIEKLVIPILSPDGILVFIGTRWHYADYWSKLLQKDVEKDGMYVVRVYRAFPDWPDDLKVLWDKVWSRQRLLERKAEIGTLRFNCLYQNDPSDYTGLIFKDSWLRYYDPVELKFITRMRLFIGVDPAISEDPKSDYTVIAVLGYNPYRSNFYLLDVHRAHLDFPDQLRMIWQKYDQWNKIAENYEWGRVLKVGVETVAYQRILVPALSMVRSPDAPGEFTRRLLPVVRIKHVKDKVSRMLGLKPYFENGRFYLPDPNVEKLGWLEAFIEEYLSFPRGVHDDILDAVDCAVEAADVTKAYGGGFYFG